MRLLSIGISVLAFLLSGCQGPINAISGNETSGNESPRAIISEISAKEKSSDSAPRPVAAESLTYQLAGRDFSVNERLQLIQLRRYDFQIGLHALERESDGAIAWSRAQPGGRYKVDAIWTALGAFDGVSSCLAAATSVGSIDTMGRLQVRLMMPIEFRDQVKAESAVRISLRLTSLEDSTAAYHGAGPFSVTARSGEERDLTLTSVAALPEACRGIWRSHFRIWHDGEGSAVTPAVAVENVPVQLLADYVGRSGRVTLEDNLVRKSAPGLVSACAHLSKQDLAGCVDSPESFFHSDEIVIADKIEFIDQEHVEGEVRQIRQTASIGTELNQTERYAQGRRDSELFLQSYAAKLGFERFGNGFQFTAAYNRQHDLFRVTEVAATQEEKVSSVIDDYTVLTSEALRVPLQISAKTCHVIQPHPSLARTVESRIECSPASELSYTESWFQIRDRQYPLGSVHLDPMDSRLAGYTRLIRGEKAYESFRRAMEDRTRRFRFEKVDTTSAFGASERMTSIPEDGGLFPGALAIQSTATSKWTLSQTQTSVKTCAEAAIGHELRSDLRTERAIAACGCLYDVIALRWTFDEFTKDWKRKMRELEKGNWKSRCGKFATENVQ